MKRYSDAYLATDNKDPSYVGNLSIVVHKSNKTRISCANFVLKGNGTVPATTAAPYSTPSPTGGLNLTAVLSTHTNTGGPKPTSPPPAQQPPNAAHKVAAGAGALAMAALAVML